MSLPSVSDLIHLKSNLQQDKIVSQIKKIVQEKLGDLTLTKYKLDIEFTLLIAKLVINLSNELGLTKSIDTTVLVIEIITQIHGLQPNEIELIKTHLAFLTRKKLIKLIPLWKRAGSLLTSMILKKIL
jgi:hypothetical protein